MHPSYLPYPNFHEFNPINYGVYFFLTVSKQTRRLAVVGTWHNTDVLLCSLSPISQSMVISLIQDHAKNWGSFFEPEGKDGTKRLKFLLVSMKLVSWQTWEEFADIISNQKLLASMPQGVKYSHNRFNIIVQNWMVVCRW
jgi:hypothetical protein